MKDPPIALILCKQLADSVYYLGYHPASFCKMSRGENAMAVLDKRVFVLGVKHLRVVDASVMPKFMGKHPQITVYGIGEKAADMIRLSAEGAA